MENIIKKMNDIYLLLQKEIGRKYSFQYCPLAIIDKIWEELGELATAKLKREQIDEMIDFLSACRLAEINPVKAYSFLCLVKNEEVIFNILSDIRWCDIEAFFARQMLRGRIVGYSLC